MVAPDWFEHAFARQPVMAILRGYPRDQTLELCELAWDLGIGLLEIPVQTPEALQTLADVVREGRGRGHLVGAGTVLWPEQVEAVSAAGAAFTVSPGLDADVVRASHAAGLPTLPGVATPSEIQAAYRLGLRWLKMFPAAALGAGWIAAMRGPFPDLCCVATGGVDAGNAAEFLDAGAAAVAVGSALADPDQLPALSALTRPR